VIDAYLDLVVGTATDDLEFPTIVDAVPLLGALEFMNLVLAERQVREEAARRAVTAAYLNAIQAATPRASAPATTRCAGNFDCFKVCTLRIESNGNYAAISPGGTYRGAWQFNQATWNGAVARAGYPGWSGRDPAQAPPEVQDAAARQLYSERGNQPWGGRC
jgi:hypothetical protein